MFRRTEPRSFSDAAHPYSSAREAAGLLFVSGQLGVDRGDLVDGGIAAETEQAFVNLRTVLMNYDLTLRDVVKITVYLASLRDRRSMDAVYERILSEPRPARTCFAVGALPYGARIEIDAIAVRRAAADGE